MKHALFILLNIFLAFQLTAQSFAPAAGLPGSTAIHKDSSTIVFWASGIDLQRGYLDISNKTLGAATFGQAENALYEAEGNPFDIVSLGDSGVAVLTFPYPISDGEGNDFAVFENGFTDNYLELAFVEVSSDGVNYVRFPSVSELPVTEQMGNYEFWDCGYVNNLAGKYRQGYGTPFDLAELAGSGLDLENITHVKIIDVIGSINPQFASRDSQGNIINDPWPSAFESGGFDLDGVGVIHSGALGMKEESFPVLFAETEDAVLLKSTEEFTYHIISPEGKMILENKELNTDVSIHRRPQPQLVFLMLSLNEETKTYRIFY